MMEPLISIGMPVWNCERTIGATIRSILHQTHRNWELLLIDDGSTDQTLEIARSFGDSRIKIIADGRPKKLPEFSIATRLNQAIAISQGTYFARMDSDDIAYPDRLKTQVEYLESHPEVDLVGSRVLLFDREGHALGHSPALESHTELCSRPWAGFYITHPTWMGKLAWFRAHQYRAEVVRCEDQDLLLRTYGVSHFACVPQILLGYRQEALSLKKTLVGRYYFSRSLLREALAEQRYFLAFGVIGQAAKALIDIFAIGTGLNYKLLWHRKGNPVNSADLVQWQQVLAACDDDLAAHFSVSPV